MPPERILARWRQKQTAPTARQVMRLLRRCLEQGLRVELEGLGSFLKTDSGDYQFQPSTQPKIFVAYVQENLPEAEALVRDLRKNLCDPWLDRERLLPGQNWPRAIERAIEVADYFVALFSRRSVVKKGQFQAELRYALDCARRHPLDRSFLVPVRLEECTVPRRIANWIQYVDLFPDWDHGMDRLVRTVRQRNPGC